MKLLLLVVAVIAFSAVDAAKEKAIKVKDKDMMRKMIIYDKVKTVPEAPMDLVSSLLNSSRKIRTCFTAPCRISSLSPTASTR